MAHCDEFIELISAAIDGALSPHDQKRLEDHLAQCPECKALYEDLSALHTALSQLPPVEVPAGLSERIMEAVAAEKVIPLAPAEKKKSPLRWQRFLATAAVLAVVWMGTWVWKPWEMKASPSAVLNTGLQQSGNAASSAEVFQDALETADLASEEPDAAFSQKAATGALAPEPCPESTDPTARDGSAPQEEKSVSSADNLEESTVDEAASIAPRMAQVTGDREDKGKLPALPAGAPEETGPAASDRTNAPAAQTFMATSSTTDAPSEAEEAMTGREALDILLEAYPMPENASLVDTGERLGWETSLAPVDGGSAPNAQQVSTRLEYIGVSPNGKYHEFWLSSFLLDDPAQGLAHSSTINYFAVPLDGGEILVQRSTEPDRADRAPEAYQKEIEAYDQALSQ